MENMNYRQDIACFLDLADHRADSKLTDIEALCEKVLKYRFNAAFVNPCFVSFAKERLRGHGKVGTVVSFPLGQDALRSKISAAELVAKLGADEIDVSSNVGLIKMGKVEEYLRELSEIVDAVKTERSEVLVKFIIETGFLTDEEIKSASQLVLKSRADFVKTCSGVGPRGAILSDVALIRDAVGDKIKVKVAGGITTYEQAAAFIEAGADRIGTSHAVEIIEGASLSKESVGE